MKGHTKSTCGTPTRASADVPYLDRWLRSDRQREAAFKELCDAGCDRIILGNLFPLLNEPGPMKLESGHEINMRRLDAETASNPLDLEGLKQIVGKANSLIKDLERLKETPLVRTLRAQGAFPPGDLLSGSAIRGLVPAAFQGLLELPERVKGVSHTSPDQNRILARIYDHIYACTGRPHDALVADVLGAPWNAALLKARRSRKNLRSNDQGSSDPGHYESFRQAIQARDGELHKSTKHRFSRSLKTHSPN